MALNPTLVGTAVAGIAAASAPPAGTQITPSQLQTMWQNIMGAIYGPSGGVAGATVTVTVTSVTAVTPGGGVSGPGAGTAVIT